MRPSNGVLEILALSLVVVFGCARAPVKPETFAKDPKELLEIACAPGTRITSVKGTVWIRAKSKDASGQFPAAVQVDGPQKMRMEVQNPLGGTEALIQVDGKDFQIQISKRPDRSQRGRNSWAGIPLRWAPDLFLGRIPCPSKDALQGASFRMTEAGDLNVDLPASVEQDAQTFQYRFRDLDGKAWPESLRWERRGALASTVEFKFEDPEVDTLSPRKWEAISPQGEVKVRWRDREVSH